MSFSESNLVCDVSEVLSGPATPILFANTCDRREIRFGHKMESGLYKMDASLWFNGTNRDRVSKFKSVLLACSGNPGAFKAIPNIEALFELQNWKLKEAVSFSTLSSCRFMIGSILYLSKLSKNFKAFTTTMASLCESRIFYTCCSFSTAFCSFS